MEFHASTSISAHLVPFHLPCKNMEKNHLGLFTFLFLSKLYLALYYKQHVIILKYHTMKKVTLQVLRNEQGKFCSFIKDKKKMLSPCKTGITKSESFVILKCILCSRFDHFPNGTEKFLTTCLQNDWKNGKFKYLYKLHQGSFSFHTHFHKFSLH